MATSIIKKPASTQPTLEWHPTFATGDFNNLTTNGFYYSQNGMTANKPATGGLYCYIIVISFAPAVTVQIVIHSAGTMYIRTYSGAPKVWSSWRQF